MTAESLPTSHQENPEIVRLRVIDSTVELGARAVKPVVPPVLEWGPSNHSADNSAEALESTKVHYDTFTD